jgi:hypothetical protein
LSGYQQLEAMVMGLDQIRETNLESDYLLQLRTRVERVLAKNKTVAEDLKRTLQILLQVAQCLRYPPSAQELQFDEQISSQLVAKEMTKLIGETRPSGRVQRAQTRLQGVLKRRWELFGQELLYCYDIPGLPQDNLHLESLFGRLRRHQRRISGHKSKRLFLSENKHFIHNRQQWHHNTICTGWTTLIWASDQIVVGLNPAGGAKIATKYCTCLHKITLEAGAREPVLRSPGV